MFVPVISQDQKPLMPTNPGQARQWIRSGKATPYWKKGVFCVRLNQSPSGTKKQEVVVGIDPGSKKEAFTVKSKAHTYLNIQADAVTWVKDRVEDRKYLRRIRRNRNTPCRKPRWNRSSLKKAERLPPSTKARWQWKLRIVRWLEKMYPITAFVVEDIKAKTQEGQRRWNKSFSPLQQGKQWLYQELGKVAPVVLKQGYETSILRDELSLTKDANKLSDSFYAHCVDSWVLANSIVGEHTKPDNAKVLYITPLQFHRRQLHRQRARKGESGIRRPYGSTRSHGFKRGSIVKHSKWGVAYVGGTTKQGIVLQSLKDGSRLCANAKPQDCRFKCYSSWRTR